jgi:hypothetical protein
LPGGFCHSGLIWMMRVVNSCHKIYANLRKTCKIIQQNTILQQLHITYQASLLMPQVKCKTQ